MWLKTFFTLKRSAFVRQVARQKSIFVRPSVETLEDRCTPSFLAPVSSAGGGNSISVGDLNHDGRADVVALIGKDSVGISLGNGDGTFRLVNVLKAPNKQTLAEVGIRDTNGDGNLDIEAYGWGNKTKTVCQAPGECTTLYAAYTNVWLGAGDGSFGSIRTKSLGFSYGGFIYNPTSVQADFNRDGILDQAWAAGGVALGNSDGTYQPVQIYNTGPNPGSIAAGDVNGDGWIDLIVVNSLSSSQPTLTVLFNDGSW